ncbi:MAG: hypothetical protein WAK26_02330 [Terracidiphilus sp.]
MAGKTYSITITGTGFGPYQLPPPQGQTCTYFFQATVDTGSVAIPAQTVVSSTEITATVTPDASDPTETACIYAGGGYPMVVRAAASATPATTTPGSCTAQGGFPVQILGAPEIQWTQNGTTSTISVVDDGSGTEPKAQPVVVGQQIKLKTKPDADKLAALGLAFSENKWKVGGTRIKNYAPTTASASVKKMTDDDLGKADVTFYWVYPEDNNIPVTYKYCVDIPGADADGQCSLVAKAAFTVTGVDSSWINITNEILANIDDLTGCDLDPGGPTLVYGDIQGPTGPCSTPTNLPFGTPGITFYPAGTPPGAGNYLFAQLIGSDVAVDSRSGATTTCTDIPGVDGTYPYQHQINPPSTSDSPETPLPSTYTTVTRNFNATMYLLWQSTATANSIPVPLGYIPWTFNGVATNSGTAQAPAWTASGAGAPISGNGAAGGAFVPADPTQPNLGIPIWSGPAVPSANCTNN